MLAFIDKAFFRHFLFKFYKFKITVVRGSSGDYLISHMGYLIHAQLKAEFSVHYYCSSGAKLKPFDSSK